MDYLNMTTFLQATGTIVGIVAFCYFGQFSVLVIHEGAHWLVAFLAGHDIEEIAVGPIVLRKDENDRLRFTFRPTHDSGHVKVGLNFARVSLAEQVMLSAAGNLANLVLGVALIWLFHDSERFGLLVIAGAYSVFCGLLGLVPMDQQGRPNDMKSILLDVKAARQSRVGTRYPFAAPLIKPTFRLRRHAGDNAVAIRFLNDDVTPMEFVTDLLSTYLYLNRYATYMAMWHIHVFGSCQIGWLQKDQAELVVSEIQRQARNFGYPLGCDLLPMEIDEPAESPVAVPVEGGGD